MNMFYTNKLLVLGEDLAFNESQINRDKLLVLSPECRFEL